MSRLLGLILLVLILHENVIAKLPSYVKTCRRHDPLIANCILDSINHLRPIISTGNYGRDFESFPRIEPFYIPTIAIGNRREFKSLFSNVYIKGGSQFLIEKLKVNMQELKFDAIIRFPRLELSAKYDLIFNLFGLRLIGKGDASSIIENSRGRVSMRARRYFNNGAEYLNFEKFIIKIQIGDVKHAYLSNLFDGARSNVFKEIANSLIRSQPEFILQEINLPIENHLSQIFTTISNKLAATATFDELFPL